MEKNKSCLKGKSKLKSLIRTSIWEGLRGWREGKKQRRKKEKAAGDRHWSESCLGGAMISIYLFFGNAELFAAPCLGFSTPRGMNGLGA